MEKKRTYDVVVSVEDDILELVWTGDITRPYTHKMMMEEIISLEKSANVKTKLVDVRDLKGRLETFELYNFVRDYPADRPKMRVAYVDTPEHDQTASFHETTALNAGLRFKRFTDIDEARKWLKNK